MDNMEKEGGKVSNEINRSEPKHLDKRALCTRSDERHDGQDSDDQASIQIGTEVKLPVIEETAEKVKTESCDDGQINTERKENIRLGTSYGLERQNSSPEDLSLIPNEFQLVQNIDDISEQLNSEDSSHEDFQVSLYNNTNCVESIDYHPRDYTENYITEQFCLKITQIFDDYDDPNKFEIKYFGNTIYIDGSCLNNFINKMQDKEKFLHTIKSFFKRDYFESYDKCRHVYDKFCYDNLNRELTVCAIVYESSSESESENESTRTENEMPRQGNESPGIEEATFGSGNRVLNQENGVSRQGTGSCGLESNASRLENEESRQDNDANLMRNHNIYRSDFGNYICHPTDEIELAERSLVNEPSLTNVQTEQQHCITQNHMVVSFDSRSRTESNLGKTLVTTESSGATSNSSVLTSGSSRELFYGSSQVSDRTRVPQLPSLFQDSLDGHMPNTRGAAWHTHSIEDLPILLANPVGAGFQDTCPLDPGLMILLYQMKTNSGLLPIFTSSTHSIFKEELPALLNLFCDRKFEELRQKWSDIIQWRRNSFYGMDTEVMMPPFSGLLHYMYRLTCTSTTCPANKRIFCMPDIRLSCPARAFLDYRIIQHLIDRFQHEERSPCGELIYHTRPDTIDVSPVVNSFYQTDTNSQCYGTLITERRVNTLVEQPPVIVLNMARSFLRRDQIGDLNGTVQIGDTSYYIGGVTFSGYNHFTARILLPHRNMQLFYDNSQGIQVIQEYPLEPAFARLSLLFLFREG